MQDRRTGVAPPLCLQEAKAEAFAGGGIIRVAGRVIAAGVRGDEIIAHIDVVSLVVGALIDPVDGRAFRNDYTWIKQAMAYPLAWHAA